MIFISILRKSIIFSLLLLAISGCSTSDDAGDVLEPSNTIADFIGNNPDYTSLNAALLRTGLKNNLFSSGRFTFFAPNNAAFNAFLSKNAFENLDAVPAEVLTHLMLNHIVQGEIRANELATGYLTSSSTFSPNGDHLSMYVSVSDDIRINSSTLITKPEILLDNGVIHTVDAVINLPDILTFLIADPSFDQFVAAMERDENFGLLEVLQVEVDPAPFTLFAPANDGFVKLLEESELESIDEILSNDLQKLLSYHIAGGVNIRKEDFKTNMIISTLKTGEIRLIQEEDFLIIDERERVSQILITDIQATNGVIHNVEKVLLPEQDL